MKKLKGIFSLIAGFFNEAVIGMMETFQEHLEHIIDKVVPKVIKTSVLFLLFVLGTVFLLIGLANYLQATFQLVDGSGQLIIGAGLFVLALIVKALK